MRVLILLLLLCSPAFAQGEVRVWKTPGLGPNVPGNLQATDGYGTAIDCSLLLPGPCIQAAINTALPSGASAGARNFTMGAGYIGLAKIVIPGYQSVSLSFIGVSFLDVTFRSAEMNYFDFSASQVDIATWVPNDRGAPGGDLLCQIVDTPYVFGTLFRGIIDLTPTTAECPYGGAFSNASIEVAEFNVSNPTLDYGMIIFSPRLASQNFNNLSIKALHFHKDQAAGVSVFLRIGDQAPHPGARFGLNSYDLAFENNGTGAETGIETFAKHDMIKVRARGFTTGNIILFRPGSCGNVAIIETERPAALTNVLDQGGCAAGDENRVSIVGWSGVTGSITVPCGILSVRDGLIVNKGTC